MVGGLLQIGSELIKRVIPDKTEQAKAQAELLRVEQAGELKELDARMSAITTEAKHKSWLVAAARPMFLYVMYIMILASFPIGYWYYQDPEAAKQAIAGVRFWLDSIPPEMWGLFGAGYLGYVNKRSQDKAIAAGQPAAQGFLSKIIG